MPPAPLQVHALHLQLLPQPLVLLLEPHHLRLHLGLVLLEVADVQQLRRERLNLGRGRARSGSRLILQLRLARSRGLVLAGQLGRVGLGILHRGSARGGVLSCGPGACLQPAYASPLRVCGTLLHSAARTHTHDAAAP